MFNFNFLQALEGVSAAPKTDPDAEAKKEAMAVAEERGKALCEYCGEEIFKNMDMPGGGWTWESELLLGFCDKAGSGHKHKPMLKWDPEKGTYHA